MASSLHIPIDELPSDTKALLDRARESAEVFIEGNGEAFKLSRLPGRTAAQALEIMKTLPGAGVPVDDDWATDLLQIIHENRSNDRDPWA